MGCKQFKIQDYFILRTTQNEKRTSLPLSRYKTYTYDAIHLQQISNFALYIILFLLKNHQIKNNAYTYIFSHIDHSNIQSTNFASPIDSDGVRKTKYTIFKTKQIDNKVYPSSGTTELVYYNYRYYSSELGRWLSKDPIEERRGYLLECTKTASLVYHTHFREYDPIHGRWLSEDPAGYRDGMNLYAAYMGVNGIDPLGLGALSWLFGHGYSGDEADAFKENFGTHLIGIGSGLKETVTNPGAVINKSIENTASVMARNIQDSDSIIDNVQALGTGLGYIVSSATGTKDVLESSYGIDILEERELTGMERTSKALMGGSSLILTGVGLKVAYKPTATFQGSVTAAKQTLSNVKNIPRNVLRKIKAPKSRAAIRNAYNSHTPKWRRYADTMLKRGASPEHVARSLSKARRLAGIRYKKMTPFLDRMKIYYRNRAPKWFPKVKFAGKSRSPVGYDSIYGPSVDWLRNSGKSWNDIINSALKPNVEINTFYGVK